ncbi:MAG: PAS domain-containing sensor histidine kinase [Acidobacteria bacterium]|nr:PAS domain-containing sensor histidine kinase [Acidobacteriota bacterium]
MNSATNRFTMGGGSGPLTTLDPHGRTSRAAELGSLLAAWAAVALLTAAYVSWLRVTNPTIVALSLLLVVLIVAAVSTLWVAVATSVLAFVCFNFFFLPPVGTFTIADPENLVALFSLLAVSIIASHLSAQARRRARDAMVLAIEREHLLEERRDAEMVRRSGELQSALLASLSHDLKTPLTAVTVAASNLRASWLTEDQRREQIDIVLAELAHLNRLFQNLVEMARIETKAVAAEREWVQPAEIVDAAAGQVAHALREHKMNRDLAAEGTLVRLDPRLTSAALAHVLENAAQYSPPGSTIDVTVEVSATEMRITVRDRGVGIAPCDLEKVFDRSYRGAAAGQHKFGTGMGLAITRGLVVAQGGRVWAESPREGGALFTIAVPAETRTAAILEEETA